ncbi:MAG: UDP-N-acetylmuramoyl-tripeptide--D-alanyl-D-alanine ligase [Coriobacteriia bacterium]|nr:UDP-N-acetylmuramoyl-tripeptide--D-alanyl-D-alanine ligase [Coriobacteriia bacterium]
MLTASVDIVVSATGGELLSGSLSKVVSDVCIDSRCIRPGCIFVALPGERTDGHDFVLSAIDAGAKLIIVSRTAEQVVELVDVAKRRDVAVLRVDDTLLAIQALASYHRSRLHCEVLGITGSTGKTSTKDFVMAVLSAGKRTVGTQGNRNNELGVPLTVLAANADTEVLVVEMGMRGMGQIASLCQIARPTLGLLTNVGTSHIELLGSQDAVAEAKGELVRCLPATGVAFLNGDDEYSARIAGTTAATVTLYGLSEACVVRATDIELDAESRAAFTLLSPAGAAQVSLPVPGRHNVYNALAAAAVALQLGIAPELIAEKLATADMSAMRMQVINTASGLTLVNDAYNANPASMRAAVDTLAAMVAGGRRIAVLGDMAELGSLTELAHFRIGEAVARLGIDELVTVGVRAHRIAEGALAHGMSTQHVRVTEDAESAAEALGSLAETGDIVLVKASRVMGLEVVVDRMVALR